MRGQREFSELLKDYPKEAILKDGTGVTLRPLKVGDEEALFKMFSRLSVDDLWFLNHDVSDPRRIAEWINNLDPSRVISIAGLMEGRIVGNAVLMMKRHGAKSHIGKVRISVDPGFRDRRLGTWMLLDLVNLSIEMGLQMLVMRLVQDRDAALIKSVRKLDFTEEAVLKDYLMGGEGQAHNLVIMIKRLPMACYDS
jgi:ribosomal protein S18 acetylase RimI-like enzyme